MQAAGEGLQGQGRWFLFSLGGPAKWEGGGILNHGRGGAGVFMDLPGGWSWMLQGEKIVEGLGRLRRKRKKFLNLGFFILLGVRLTS